jgi:hypothetical protein
MIGCSESQRYLSSTCAPCFCFSFLFETSSLQSSNRCAHLHESNRTLRDGSFGWHLSQALRARLRSHRPSGTRSRPAPLGHNLKSSLSFRRKKRDLENVQTPGTRSRVEVRREALSWSLDIFRNSRLEFAPRRGWRAQPRVSTLGTDQPTRRALKGRQIERPNKVEIRVQWRNCNMFELPL